MIIELPIHKKELYKIIIKSKIYIINSDVFDIHLIFLFNYWTVF